MSENEKSFLMNRMDGFRTLLNGRYEKVEISPEYEKSLIGIHRIHFKNFILELGGGVREGIFQLQLRNKLRAEDQLNLAKNYGIDFRSDPEREAGSFQTNIVEIPLGQMRSPENVIKNGAFSFKNQETGSFTVTFGSGMREDTVRVVYSDIRKFFEEYLNTKDFHRFDDSATRDVFLNKELGIYFTTEVDWNNAKETEVSFRTQEYSENFLLKDVHSGESAPHAYLFEEAKLASDDVFKKLGDDLFSYLKEINQS